MSEVQIGDKVLASPVGPGTMTGITEAGYPQVNGVAVAWCRFEIGDFNPHGKDIAAEIGKSMGIGAIAKPIKRDKYSGRPLP